MEILITILSIVSFGIGYGLFALKPIIAAVLAFEEGVLTGGMILWAIFECWFIAPIVSVLVLGIITVLIIVIRELIKND